MTQPRRWYRRCALPAALALAGLVGVAGCGGSEVSVVLPDLAGSAVVDGGATGSTGTMAFPVNAPVVPTSEASPATN